MWYAQLWYARRKLSQGEYSIVWVCFMVTNMLGIEGE